MATVSSGMITIESHSKQVKLLNDYIMSLQKKINQNREVSSSKMLKLSDESNRLSQENIRIKNQVGALKSASYKYEETLRRVSQLQQETTHLRQTLEREQADKNELHKELQNIKEYLINCQKHLQAAEIEINNRTQYFQRQIGLLNTMRDEGAQKLEENKKENEELNRVLVEERKRFSSHIQGLQKNSGDILKQKSQAMSLLYEELEEAKNKLQHEKEQTNLMKKNYSSKSKQFQNMLQIRKNQLLNKTKQIFDLNQLLKKRDGEVTSLTNELNQGTQEYKQLVVKSREEKERLLMIINRLEEDKKTLQNSNLATSGSASEQARQNAELIAQNDRLQAGLRSKEDVIVSLNSRGEQMVAKIDSLNKQILTASAENLKAKETYSSTEKKIRDELKKVSQKLSTTANQLQNVKANLLSSQKEHLEYSKKKEAEVNSLNEALKNYLNDQVSLKDRSTNVQKEYLEYRQLKQSQIFELNGRVKDGLKEQLTLKEKNEEMIKEEKLFRQKKEKQTAQLNIRLKEINKEHLTLKGIHEDLMREYSSIQKKKESESETYSDRLKDAIKKVEKKDQRIEELLQEIRQIQKVSELNRKNMDSSQRQQMEQLKHFYTQENKNLKSKLKQVNENSQDLKKSNKQASSRVEELERQIQFLREDIKSKQKLHEQLKSKMETQRQELLSELKSKHLSNVLADQTKSSKLHQVDSLKKTIKSLQSLVAEQKKNLLSLGKLVSSKEEELESVETSNAMLRKQYISSISNQEISRKEIVDLKSRNSSIMGGSRARLSMISKNGYSSTISPIRHGRTTESMMISNQAVSKIKAVRGSSQHKVGQMKESIVMEVRRLNQGQERHLPQKQTVEKVQRVEMLDLSKI